MRRIVLGMTGATGAMQGIQLLRRLQQRPDAQTHLVLSRWARATRNLDQFDIESPGARRWNGVQVRTPRAFRW
jgi:3-polyprenyl-4-hydroxybenzoate decarboxylase